MDCPTDTTRLCYLSADHVKGPRSTLDRFDVRNLSDQRIGKLDGIIIDPSARRMCYLVVDVGALRHRRYLLPLGPTRVDANTHALRVDVDRSDLTRCAEFDPHEFHSFSDDDLLAAMFHSDCENAEHLQG